jgi:hypothetical protein
MAAATLVEVAEATWAAALVGAAGSMAVAATAEALAATTGDTAAGVMEAAIAAARIPEVMQAEGHTAARTQAEAPLPPDRGRGKVKALRGTLLRVGTDSREIMAR